MELEGIEWAVGGGEDLDVEVFEECAWEKLGGLEFLRDQVVVLICVVSAEPLGEAELVLEGVVQPETGGCAAKEEVVLCEDAPDLTRVGVGSSIELGDSE